MGCRPIRDDNRFKGERRGFRASWEDHLAGWDGLIASWDGLGAR